MMLKRLVKAIINTEHGWAVADQFEGTFDGEPFEQQNGNALKYIKMCIEDIIDSDLLSEEAQEELIEYREDLVIYLTK